MKVIWSPAALENAEEISDYIALDNKGAAVQWIEDAFRLTKSLSTDPEIGRVVPELEDLNLRELIFGNYRIIYSIEQSDINIHTVRHFKRLLSARDLGF